MKKREKRGEKRGSEKISQALYFITSTLSTLLSRAVNQQPIRRTKKKVPSFHHEVAGDLSTVVAPGKCHLRFAKGQPDHNPMASRINQNGRWNAAQIICARVQERVGRHDTILCHHVARARAYAYACVCLLQSSHLNRSDLC